MSCAHFGGLVMGADIDRTLLHGRGKSHTHKDDVRFGCLLRESTVKKTSFGYLNHSPPVCLCCVSYQGRPSRANTKQKWRGEDFLGVLYW